MIEAYDVKWNKEGDHYAILFDRKVVIYNMNAEPQVSIEHPVRIHCIRYLAHPVHGETVLLGTDDKLIRIHSVSDGSLLQELKGHRARYPFLEAKLIDRVKAFDTTAMSHGVDLQLLVSASSDGEVKSWTMTTDGNVTENGSYDTGNRLLCLCLHDSATEQLDAFPLRIRNDNADSNRVVSNDSEPSDDEAAAEEEEWDGIRD